MLMPVSPKGTGTILDAWKLGLPIVVVPNTKLLNNHQTELAKHLAQEGYAIQSTTRLEHLQEAIHKTELLQEDNKSRWPPNNPTREKREAPISFWDIKPGEVRKEEAAQMTHD
jgi:beta-1,4-N-acetylglucosaminyltransferase